MDGHAHTPVIYSHELSMQHVMPCGIGGTGSALVDGHAVTLEELLSRNRLHTDIYKHTHSCMKSYFHKGD